ncbi:MAG TPA: hypothetical protein PKC40_00030 [Saprospiraceae bacterium]|nr:hypothetical protein [Saprospiraceae bacterium]
MAKHIDLSGLKKQPLKKKETPKIEEVVSAIHKEAATEKSEMEEENKEPVKRITLDLPASLHTKLKIRAVQEQITIRSFVIDILEQILD